MKAVTTNYGNNKTFSTKLTQIQASLKKNEGNVYKVVFQTKVKKSSQKIVGVVKTADKKNI